MASSIPFVSRIQLLFYQLRAAKLRGLTTTMPLVSAGAGFLRDGVLVLAGKLYAPLPTQHQGETGGEQHIHLSSPTFLDQHHPHFPASAPTKQKNSRGIEYLVPLIRAAK